MTAAFKHQSEQQAPGNRKCIFIHTFRREALRSLLALTVVASVLVTSGVSAHQALDQVEQLTQQQVDQDSFAFPYGADNDQSLIPVQQQQLNGNFGNRPSGRPVRPDFSSFGLRPTTSTTTESSQQQQQSEDVEQQQTGSGQQDGQQQQIVQQNNSDGEDEQAATQAPSTTRKPSRPTGGNAGQQQQRPIGSRPNGSRPRPISTTSTSTTTTTTEQPIQTNQGNDESNNETQTGNGEGENTNSLDNNNDSQQQQQEENNADQRTSTRSPISGSQGGRPTDLGSNGGEFSGPNSAGRPTGGRPSTDATGSQQQLQEELQQVVDGGDQESGTSSQQQPENGTNNETDDSTGGSTSDEDNSQQQQVDAKPSTSTRSPNQRPKPTRAPTTSTTVTTTAPISQQNGQQEVDSQFEGGNNNQEDNQDSTGQQQQQDESGRGEQDVSSQTTTTTTTPSTTTSTTTTTTRAPANGGKSGSRPRGQHVPLKGKPVATPMSFVNQQRLQSSQLTSNNGPSDGTHQSPRPNGQKGSSRPAKTTRRPLNNSGGANSRVPTQSGFGASQQQANLAQNQQQVNPSNNGNGQSGRQTTESPIVQQNNLSGEEESQTGNEQPLIPSSRPVAATGTQNQNRPQGTSNGAFSQQRPSGPRPRPASTTTTSTTTEQPIQVTQGEDDTSQGTQTGNGNGDGENTNSLDNNNDNQEQQQQQQEQQAENIADSTTRAPTSGSEGGSRPTSGSNTSGSSHNNLSGGHSSPNRPTGGRPVSQQQQEELQQVVNGGDSDSDSGSQDSGNGPSTTEGEDTSSGNGTGTSSDEEEQQKVDIVSTSTTSTRRPSNQRPIFSKRPSTTTTTTTTNSPVNQQTNQENDGQFDQNISQENTNGSGNGSGSVTEGQESGDESETGNGFSQQAISSTTTTQAPTTSAATTRSPVSGQQSKGSPRGSLTKDLPVTAQRQLSGPISGGKSSASRTSTGTQSRVPTAASVGGDKKGSPRAAPLQKTFVVQPSINGQPNLIVPGPFMQPMSAQFPEMQQQAGQVLIDAGLNEEFSQQQLPTLQPSQGPRFVMVPMAMRQQILDFAQQQNLIPPQAPIFLGPQINEQQQMLQQQVIQQQLFSGPVVEPTFKARPPKPIIGGSFQQSTKTSSSKPLQVSNPSRLGAQQVFTSGGVPVNAGQTSAGQSTKQQGPRRLSWMTNLLPSNQGSRQAAGQQQAIKQTLTPSSQSRQLSTSGQSAGVRPGTKQQQSTFSSAGVQQQTSTSTNELPVSSGIQSPARATKTQQQAQQQLQESQPTTGPINNGQQTGPSSAQRVPARPETTSAAKGRRPSVSQSTDGLLKPTRGQGFTSGQLVNEQRQLQQPQLVNGNANAFGKGSMRPLKPVDLGQQSLSPATAFRGTKTQSTTGVSQQQIGSDVFRPSVIQSEAGSSSFGGSDNSAENHQSNIAGVPLTGPNASTTSQGSTKGGRSKLANGLNSPRAQAARMSPGAKSRLATKNLLAQQQLITN